jgi:hypothetical protein
MMDKQTRGEFNRALEIADAVDMVLSSSGAHQGIALMALAQLMATAAARAQPGNPAGSRRMINETLALARGLLTDMNNRALSQKSVEAMRVLVDLGTTQKNWAVGPVAQDIIVKAVLPNLDGKPFLEVMAALQTVMANMICDHSDTNEEATAGLEACLGDMRAVLLQRFVTPELRDEPAAGRA